MSSISSISSYGVANSYSGTFGMQRPQRPSAEEMASDLFSKLDSSGKGYIQESDLESALSAIIGSSSSSSTDTTGTASASEIFSQLDSDGDGKVTEDEMASGFQKLADALDSQFEQSRMQGAMPPPPPPKNDTGFTKDELTEQLSEIGSSDSGRASFISNVVENFDAADTNGDGKVTFQEAMAYNESSSSSSSTSSSSSSSTTSSSSSTTSSQVTDAQVFRQLMDLLRTYDTGNDATKNTLSTLISAIA